MNFPLEFSVSSSSSSGIDTQWDAAFEKTSLKCAIPPSFEGPGNGASPEDLYALSLLNCYIATFKVIAEKSRLNYERIEGTGKLVLDQDSNGNPWTEKVILDYKLFNPDNRNRAERILKKVETQSMVINSVKSNVEINWTVI
jgi:organic hydroperoxide reductase OsmC/OhrA